jgi:hypothetical protein
MRRVLQAPGQARRPKEVESAHDRPGRGNRRRRVTPREDQLSSPDEYRSLDILARAGRSTAAESRARRPTPGQRLWPLKSSVPPPRWIHEHFPTPRPEDRLIRSPTLHGLLCARRQRARDGHRSCLVRRGHRPCQPPRDLGHRLRHCHSPPHGDEARDLGVGVRNSYDLSCRLPEVGCRPVRSTAPDYRSSLSRCTWALNSPVTR